MFFVKHLQILTAFPTNPAPLTHFWRVDVQKPTVLTVFENENATLTHFWGVDVQKPTVFISF